MYFNYKGAWTGGHDVVGPTPRLKHGTWLKERHEQASRSGSAWRTREASNITVKARYLLGPGQGAPINESYTVPAKQRLTVSVNKEIGTNKDDSVQLTSTGSFIAERPMYFKLTTMSGRAAPTSWGPTAPPRPGSLPKVPPGITSPSGLPCQNPGNSDAHATITYYTASGQAIKQVLDCKRQYKADRQREPGRRSQPGHIGEGFIGQPDIVERPMYFTTTVCGQAVTT